MEEDFSTEEAPLTEDYAFTENEDVSVRKDDFPYNLEVFPKNVNVPAKHVDAPAPVSH